MTEGEDGYRPGVHTRSWQRQTSTQGNRNFQHVPAGITAHKAQDTTALTPQPNIIYLPGHARTTRRKPHRPSTQGAMHTLINHVTSNISLPARREVDLHQTLEPPTPPLGHGTASHDGTHGTPWASGVLRFVTGPRKGGGGQPWDHYKRNQDLFSYGNRRGPPFSQYSHDQAEEASKEGNRSPVLRTPYPKREPYPPVFPNGRPSPVSVSRTTLVPPYPSPSLAIPAPSPLPAGPSICYSTSTAPQHIPPVQSYAVCPPDGPPSGPGKNAW